MALIAKEPVMIEVSPNNYSKVGYVWLELSCIKADTISVNAKLYKSKEDKNEFPSPMTPTKYIGELDSNIYDPEMGKKAHELALTLFPEFKIEA